MASSFPSTAVDVTRPTSNGAEAPRRRLDIQGLRAVAVLMVVAFHAGLPVPGGFVGVDVFFVISGFVITAMLMRERATTGRIQLVRFYVRRFRRLTPALALTVCVVMVASALLLSPSGSQQTASLTAIGAMLLAANVVIARTSGDYFDAPAESNPLLNTWSLSVEEQFYLVFPAILVVGWLGSGRARKTAFSPVIVVGAIGTASFALAVAGSAGLAIASVPESLVGFYGPATRAWEFAAGGLLALGGAKLDVTSTRLAGPLVVAGAGLVIASLWLITGTTPFPGGWTLLPVIGTLLLIAAGSGRTAVARTLATRPMVAIGDWSYSIYLWHWPCIVFARLYWPGSPVAPLAAAVLSFLPAYASYRWLEQPIRALPHLGGRSLARLVAATVIPPLAIAGALGFAAQSAFWLPAVKEYQSALQPSYASRLAGCHATIPLDQRKPGDCIWNASAAGRPIYLVGDSNADHFSDGIILAGRALARPVISATASACPFVDVPFVSLAKDQAGNDTCRAYVQGSLKHLGSSAPGTVIISASDTYWTSEQHRVGDTGEVAAKLLALRGGLSSTVRFLQGAGHSVLLVQSIPRWTDEDSLKDCSLISLLASASGCDQELPIARAMERQGAVRAVVSAVAGATGAEVLDPWATLCAESVCRSAQDGLTRYRDGTHITVKQSAAMAGVFERALTSAG
ncbi:MAG: acyltransferase family protein [Micropruina sp.]